VKEETTKIVGVENGVLVMRGFVGVGGIRVAVGIAAAVCAFATA